MQRNNTDVFFKGSFMKSKDYHLDVNIVLISICIALFAFIINIAAVSVFATPEDDSPDVEKTEASGEYIPSEYRLANDAINEWEDRVLIAAMGKLEDEGRIYYAYGDYVDELINYLSKDDLDLTEKDAEDAIAQIADPANARAGALSGYLYQIGGKPMDTDSLVESDEYDGKIYPEFDEKVRFANEQEYRASDLYLKNKAYIEERTNTVYESQVAMRKEMRELAKADREYKKILATKPADAAITEIKAPKSVGITFVILATLLLVLTVAVIIYGWKSRTISILRDADYESWNSKKSHKEKHHIRKNSAIILIIVLALDLTLLYAGLVYYRTIGSNNFIEDSMNKGGICQHNFMEFRDDTHAFLNKNNLPANALDRALSYRDYRFDFVKGVKSAIKSGSSEVTYRGVHDAVEAQIDLLSYVTKRDSSGVIDGINKLYEGSLSADAGVFIHNMRESLKGAFRLGYILSIVSMLLAAAMLVLERYDIRKGIRDLSFGVLGGTILWAIVAAFVLLIKGSKVPGVADDNVYVMLSIAFKGMAPFILVLLGISASATVVLYGASRLIHRR